MSETIKLSIDEMVHHFTPAYEECLSIEMGMLYVVLRNGERTGEIVGIYDSHEKAIHAIHCNALTNWTITECKLNQEIK